MSKLTKVASNGAVTVPDVGRIYSIVAENTSGGNATLTITDGDGQEVLDVVMTNGTRFEVVYNGVDYAGGLTSSGDFAADAHAHVEIG